MFLLISNHNVSLILIFVLHLAVVSPGLQLSETRQPTKAMADSAFHCEWDSDLLQEMEAYIKGLEATQFYRAFLTRIEIPQLSENILKALGTESSMPMVIYGLGNITSNENSRWQLSLAISMKRKFSWIAKIEVFDPIITPGESRVLEALGCCVLNVDEKCRRQALKPIFVFMPHCDESLYGNLLEANWEVDMLNRIVLIGNAFTHYMRNWIRSAKIKSPEKWEFHEDSKQKYILAALSFTEEIDLSGNSDEFGAFINTRWNVFNLNSESDLQLQKFSASSLSGTISSTL